MIPRRRELVFRAVSVVEGLSAALVSWEKPSRRPRQEALRYAIHVLRAAAGHLVRAADADGARVLSVLQPRAVLPDAGPLTPLEAQIAHHHVHLMPGCKRCTAEGFETTRSELAALERYDLARTAER